MSRSRKGLLTLLAIVVVAVGISLYGLSANDRLLRGLQTSNLEEVKHDMSMHASSDTIPEKSDTNQSTSTAFDPQKDKLDEATVMPPSQSSSLNDEKDNTASPKSADTQSLPTSSSQKNASQLTSAYKDAQAPPQLSTIPSSHPEKQSIIDKIGIQTADLNTDFIFSGAREWHENWLFASQKGKAISHQTHSMHDDYVAGVLQTESEAALDHIVAMKQRYMKLNALADYWARGLGWIETRLGMILTVIVAGEKTDASAGTNDNIMNTGPVSIFIIDTLGKLRCGNHASNATDPSWMDYQPPLTMWVRANGPEIHAGTALPHLFLPQSEQDRHRCAWRYDFVAQVPGPYSVEVKVLTFNGFAAWQNNDECRMTQMLSRNELFDTQVAGQGNTTELDMIDKMNTEAVEEMATKFNFSHHRGIIGFKMYNPYDACCEACSRSSGCKMWSTPGAMRLDDCELYFESMEDDLDYYDMANGSYVGRERLYSYLNQSLLDYPLSVRSEFANDAVGHKGFPSGRPPQFGYKRDVDANTTHFLGCGWCSMLTWEK